jgi:DNA-binding transcriptional ArsR family regulator
MDNTKLLARALKVLSVDARVRIVELLKNRSMCVNALANHLAITQGAVSQHLRVMRDAGLVIDDKQGYFVHYRLNESTLAEWRGLVNTLLDPEQEAESECKEC